MAKEGSCQKHFNSNVLLSANSQVADWVLAPIATCVLLGHRIPPKKTDSRFYIPDLNPNSIFYLIHYFYTKQMNAKQDKITANRIK
jgi:hypothetical protein